MKIKLKWLLLSVIALFLVACSGAGTGSENPGNPDNPDEPNFTSENWQSIAKEIGDNEAIKELKTLKEIETKNDINKFRIGDIHPSEKTKVFYNEKKLKDLDPEFQLKSLEIRGDSNLIIKSDVGEIKFREIHIHEKGKMFFVDKLSKSRVYSVSTEMNPSGFFNYGEVYVMDGNGGSTLKINGNYHSGKIFLGLYVSEDGEKISTDKVHITGDANAVVGVNFLYNPSQVDKLKENARYSGEDYVIKVDGSTAYGNFKIEPETPVGLNVYNLKLEHESGDSSENFRTWKLKIDKKK